MTEDNTIPTYPPTEPLQSSEADTLVQPAVTAELPKPGEADTLVRPAQPAARTAPPHVGHWYSFPGQNQAASPAQDAPIVSLPLRDRGRRTARDRVRKRKIRRELGAPDDWAWVIIAAALLGMTVIMSMTVFFLLQATRGSRSVTVATSGPPIEPTSVIYGPGGILESTGEAVGGMLGDGNSMVIRPWDGNERFTVLVMGMDQRPGEFGASYRTDTMILISLDPDTNQIGILSIPRDLYVDIPGYGLERVNAAYVTGELEGPGGGPRLAMQTVQYNFGIPVNEYVLVNFDTFTKVIDLIGGIHVEVLYDIYDPEYPDMNYGYDPFSISAGWHQMNGETALKYARSRHTSDDIDRNRRQQQVMLAIRDQVTATNKIPELALQAPMLWSELNNGIDTGLSLDQILELAWWVKDIPSTNYKRGVVGWEYVYSRNWEGKDILVPNRDKLGSLMVEVFGPNYNQR